MMNFLPPLLVVLTPLVPAARAQQPMDPAQALPASEVPVERTAATELVDMSLEDLMSLEIEVTSVSKQAQTLGSAPAAIFVLTNEDIRRSGARSITEALRMVPGLLVARINGSSWAVSSRGFTGRFGNKILVLIDGRSVYSTSFSGVYWDVQDLLLEDVERIEIIRGPGAALWGSNAVNGVINVITKPASKTQGTFVEMGAGSEERGFVGARFGGTLGENGHFRVYGKTFDRDGRDLNEGDTVEDDWYQRRAGFRADWVIGQDDTYTLQGDVYRGHSDAPETALVLTPPYFARINQDSDVDGGNLIGRWNHTVSDDSDFTIQAYYDVTNRYESADQSIDTFDLDYHHHLRLGESHELVFGGGYRMGRSDFGPSATVSLDPAHSTDEIFSAFVQDQVTIVPDALDVVLGTKYEHNDDTGSELQPSAMIVWTPDAEHTVWASISRAVRTPSRIETDGVLTYQVSPDPGGFLDIVRVLGNDDFASEELTAYEMGLRAQLHETVAVDLALFYNRYDSLSTIERGTPFFEGGDLVTPLYFDNKMHGTTWGAELAAEWAVDHRWSLRAGYTLLLMNLELDVDSLDAPAESAERNDPQNQLNFRSLLDLSDTVQLDLACYYVDAAPALDVPSYIRGDARLGWRPKPWIDLSFVVQGLFHDDEQEPSNSFVGGSTNSDVTYYLSASWRF